MLPVGTAMTMLENTGFFEKASLGLHPRLQ
jgi:hypothetical protein